jgi:glycerol-3-phosphate acyltransferase PlsX
MQLVTIAVDISSGDNGSLSTLPASLKFVKNKTDLKLILVGKEKDILPNIPHDLLSRIEVVNAPDVVAMDDDPVVALRKKKYSSMRLAVDLVKDKKADICVSAGNTGALMATAHTRLRTLPGVDRPAIMGVFPNKNGKIIHVLDLGANVTATSDNLFQFSVLASQLVKDNSSHNPKVALLNIGHEDIKGTQAIKEAAAMIKASPHINYVGYIEPDKIFYDDIDIIVCDGFSGNIMLKSCEGMVQLIYDKIVVSIKKRPLLALVIKRVLKSILKEAFNDYRTEERNGAVFLGLNGLVVKSHGNANKEAFLNSLRLAYDTTKKLCIQRYANSLIDILNSEVV